MSRTRKRHKRWADEFDYDDDYERKNKGDRRREKKMRKAVKTRNLDYFEENESEY